MLILRALSPACRVRSCARGQSGTSYGIRDSGRETSGIRRSGSARVVRSSVKTGSRLSVVACRRTERKFRTRERRRWSSRRTEPVASAERLVARTSCTSLMRIRQIMTSTTSLSCVSTATTSPAVASRENSVSRRSLDTAMTGTESSRRSATGTEIHAWRRACSVLASPPMCCTTLSFLDNIVLGSARDS